MYREIKLRAWNSATSTMHENVGISPHTEDYHVFDKDGAILDMYGSIPAVMEYIGRLDKHDKPMCEGDIIDYLDNTSRGLVMKRVLIEDIRHLPDFSCSKWQEIIGNMYENSDLLEVPEK